MNAKVKFDEIGYWSEVKLDIVKEYAQAYSKILAAQRDPSLCHVYIDAFAGAGVHVSKSTGEYIPGSPLNALNVYPPFCEYYLIDLNSDKATHLDTLVGERPDVHVKPGDCNTILLDEVFPRVRWEDYRRGLVLLDPYGLHLDWEVVKRAGEMRSLELFLNFPVLDMNRNVLWRNPEDVDPADILRMNRFWGDESWRDIAYTTKLNLFGYAEKEDNETIARAFQRRLRKMAGFGHVPDPVPMRNSTGNTVYYLFFASPKPVAGKIVRDVFSKYKRRTA